MLVDGVLKSALVQLLPGSVHIYTRVPADPQIPYVFAKHVGGEDVHEDIDSVKAVVLVRCVSDSLTAAHDLHVAVHKAFLVAERLALVTPYGSVESVERYQYPREIRGKQQPENETIMESMYQMSLCGIAEPPQKSSP